MGNEISAGGGLIGYYGANGKEAWELDVRVMHALTDRLSVGGEINTLVGDNLSDKSLFQGYGAGPRLDVDLGKFQTTASGSRRVVAYVTPKLQIDSPINQSNYAFSGVNTRLGIGERFKPNDPSQPAFNIGVSLEGIADVGFNGALGLGAALKVDIDFISL